ncbi:MAG TPA: hypothetical protein VI197_28150 [Polyangiaceae bacterium]
MAALAWTAVAEVLDRTGGIASVPLDDAYIHFQFARAFANFTPFVYSPGAAPVGGATSLLWPAALAPAFWLGINDVQIVWFAWLLGFLCLGLVACEVLAIAREILSPLVAFGAALATLCFGGLTWLAASGMEAVPFAWLWLRSFRRLAEWCEDEQPLPLHRSPRGRELLLLCLVTPLMRPEGELVPLCVACAFGFRLRGRQLTWVSAPIVLALLPRLCLWLGTGSLSSTTTLVKWLPHNPYLDAGEVVAQVVANLRLLHGTLLNGELWSATVVPEGGAVLALAALPSLVLQSHRKRRYLRGGAILVAALGIWLPATYDTFLWNRLRYLWPFAPAWCVALGALCEVMGDMVARFKPAFGGVRVLFSGVIVGAFAAKLPYAIADVAESAAAIQAQQVSLGRWARRNLPERARVGVNDTGAIAYFSGRQTFDIVGLTTPGEAEHWLAGPGSRFEHYERLPRRALPTHFLVYPEWFAIDPLLGEYLTERSVNASILGGTTMVAHKADYRALMSAERPVLVDVHGRKLLDRLDVADLVSESEHDYQLLQAEQQQNRIFRYDRWTDGGRAGRTRELFRLRLEPGGMLVVRAAVERPTRFAVYASGEPAGSVELVGPWDEAVLNLPLDLTPGITDVRIEVHPASAAILGYWSLGAS